MDQLNLLWKVAVISLIVAVVADGDFTAECPTECKCLWTDGKKSADCSNAHLDVVPKTLSSEIQNLNLTGNPLYEITQRAFEDVGLSNLNKLFLKDCNILTIHKNGLSGLGIIIELDLSKNSIDSLHPDTFRETERIRWILLNDNRLEKLDDGLFKNLQYLQKVELSNNRLVQLGVKTFINVPKLNMLRLDGNRLEHMKVDTLNSLPSLSSLDLHNNPWRCDCYLQPFRSWVLSKKLYTAPTSCAEPAKVHDKLWLNLASDEFACKPNIMLPIQGAVMRSPDNNVTLLCKVSGNPLPEVNWVLNSQIIDNSYRRQGEVKYYLVQNSMEHTKWLNLTILDAGGTDNGEYLCVAKNSGGVEERGIKLFVTHSGPGVVAPSGIDSNMMSVLIGVSCSAAILLILLIILCYCCCCRRKQSEKKKADTSNGEALIEGSVIPEMEKSLINAVNPVTKPPRRYEPPASITSGATEMSEMNKTLLDNDSVFAHNDDEKHSFDYDQQTKRSQEMLNADYARADGRTYPPDLLAFPPRAAQISPAASNASTVPDTTRLPPQLNPISPIHSPIYGVNQNLFRTLPYSRSQSPFTAPITPPVIATRQGYVTIPRRPRVPSWSSTASTILPSSEAQEPLYDNLGLRTTADGSSVLSLNKSGVDPMSPMRGRPLPATPIGYQTSHPVYYAPIEEQEIAPSPVPAYVISPRNSISQLQYSTPGPQEPVNPRMSWTAKNTSTPQAEPRKSLFNEPSRNSVDAQSQASDSSTLSRKSNKPETGSLRRARPEPITDAIVKKSPIKSPTKEIGRNDMNISPNHSVSTPNKSGKVPPRPPPKPKKKQTTDPNEPLFEDEGEDGTEV